jgi:exodeoxyribonuclease VII large subunit
MSALFPPAGIVVLTVGELTRAIKGLLEEAHPNVWVEGEVSNLARPASGHVYLTLKDEESPLKAVCYRGVAMRMKFDLRDGMRVIVRGRLSVYAPRGEYQLLVEEIQPKGIGPLELAFRQLKEKLSVQGYFDPQRKKRLPPFPRRVVLVTSPTGSAVRDMLEILARRWPAVEVWVCPVRVQGEGASLEIAGAIGLLNRIAMKGPSPIDVLIVGRGGGSLEDLWSFNEEIVATAIFQSRIPIVTGIGHEDDLTIADMVADQRALTPSEAAERVVPDRAEVAQGLGGLHSRLRSLLRRRLELARARLQQAADRPCFRSPLERIREHERRLDELGDRMQRALSRRLETARAQLESASGRLDGLSPLKVLGRGYSLTRRLDNLTVVRSPEQVAAGDWLVTQVHGGRIVSRVEAVTPAADPSSVPSNSPPTETIHD